MKQKIKNIIVVVVAVVMAAGSAYAGFAPRVVRGLHIPACFKRAPRQGVFPLSPAKTWNTRCGYRLYLKHKLYEHNAALTVGQVQPLPAAWGGGKVCPFTKERAVRQSLHWLKFTDIMHYPPSAADMRKIEKLGIPPHYFLDVLNTVSYDLHGMSYQQVKKFRSTRKMRL